MNGSFGTIWSKKKSMSTALVNIGSKTSRQIWRMSTSGMFLKGK